MCSQGLRVRALSATPDAHHRIPGAPQHVFPLPIPQAHPRDYSGILHYMSLEESLAMPFTDEHQPSKMSKVAATSTKNSEATPYPTIIRGRDRGMRGRGRGRAIPPARQVFIFEVYYQNGEEVWLCYWALITSQRSGGM
jgi:hypothetical protein